MNFYDAIKRSGSYFAGAVGEVTDIDSKMCRARVTFDDDDSVTSYWLPVLQPNTIDNHDYRLPDIGEDVLCVFLSKEDGYIVGSFYAGEVMPPESDRDKRTVVFSDETKVSYDRKAHALDIVIGSTKIHADQTSVSVEAPQAVALEGKQTLMGKGGQSVAIEAGQTASMSAGQSIALTAPTLTLTMGSTKMVLNGSSAQIESNSLTFKGNMTVTGNLTVNGDVSAAGNVNASGVVSGSNI